jgi:S-adenosyl-L-methionine hydrolase (adenosine-forming)
MPAVITLTTDFGLRDPWVGIMKGVILRLVDDVHLVDLTHEIAPHDVLEGALALEASVPFFPERTVHLAVVDPGVGSPRRALAVSTRGHLFVGPDNGLFTPFLEGSQWRAVEVTMGGAEAAPVGAAEPSRTFHGRDIFAPVAARLARGMAPELLGREVRDPVRLSWPVASRTAAGITGEVIHVDRFGNLITSILARDIESTAVGDHVSRAVGGVASDAVRDLASAVLDLGRGPIRLVGTYAEIAPGEVAALIGSGGRLEISMREASAAATLGLGRGARVVVGSADVTTPGTPQEHLEQRGDGDRDEEA